MMRMTHAHSAFVVDMRYVADYALQELQASEMAFAASLIFSEYQLQVSF